MDFQFSEEQVLLRDTAREVLTRAYDTETRNKVVASDLGWKREVWNQLAEIGILGLGFDEDSGPLEIMTVLTEIGRRLAPEPVLHGALIPGSVIAELGTGDQRGRLDEVAGGERLLAFAHHEPGSRWPAAAPATSAQQQGDAWTLTGRKNPVLAGDSADTFVVSAALQDGGVGLFLVDAADVTRQTYRTFDGNRAAQIDLDASRAVPLGEGGDAGEAIQKAEIRTQAALCAEAMGAMEEALRLTTEYLKARKQFGVTLNKFQTLTQRAADMYISLELARGMSFYASMSLADGNFDPLVASRAKLQIGRAARHIGQESIQLHGGIGVTAEYPVGHYTARLTAIDRTLGSSDDHLRILAGHVGDYGVVAL